MDLITREKAQHFLSNLYGADEAPLILEKMIQKMAQYPDLEENIFPTENDIFLITYGDSIIAAQNKDSSASKKSPLSLLHQFADQYLSNLITYIHFLPFFPYSSDDGFSIIDYYAINPNVGSWHDVEAIGKKFKLLFDAVINHMSAQSDWFQAFLENDERYRHYFIETEDQEALKPVFRPRTSPLLTPFGDHHIWTTFSADQVDLNFKNPDVLLQIIDLLLFYASKGAKAIRLDAIAYLWKTIGTSCMHLPETHQVIQLLRLIFELKAPGLLILTETNVPHEENISYFGDGYNEAQMVYQFPLPPLTLHAFHEHTAQHLKTWAKKLALPSDQTTFFNFLASHDGIGLMPAKGYLSDETITALADKIKKNGGLVSYKTNADGSESPYELNCNYFDALYNQDEPLSLNIDKFIAAHTLLLSMIGVPAIYIHSLVGSRNDLEGVKRTGRSRTINRKKLAIDRLISDLDDATHLRSQIFNRLKKLIHLRKNHRAFHPTAAQNILEFDIPASIFAFERVSHDQKESIMVMINLSPKTEHVELPGRWFDLITAENFTGAIKPYQALWLLAD